MQPPGMSLYFVSSYSKYCYYYLNAYFYCSYCSAFMIIVKFIRIIINIFFINIIIDIGNIVTIEFYVAFWL